MSRYRVVSDKIKAMSDEDINQMWVMKRRKRPIKEIAEKFGLTRKEVIEYFKPEENVQYVTPYNTIWFEYPRGYSPDDEWTRKEKL